MFVEEPLILSKNPATTRKLALIAGALWAMSIEFDLFWHWVDVASWKKEVVGKGNVNKVQVREWVQDTAKMMRPEERLAAYDATPDLYDAHCLAVYGTRALRMASREGA